MNRTWIERPSPKSVGVGSGWCGELSRAWIDGEYAVMSREFVTAWGDITHVCVRNVQGTDIPWSEKQRIKNELFGEEKTAIEVFPAKSELIDEANMYHLWILPEDMKLPFTLKKEQ